MIIDQKAQRKFISMPHGGARGKKKRTNTEIQWRPGRYARGHTVYGSITTILAIRERDERTRQGGMKGRNRHTKRVRREARREEMKRKGSTRELKRGSTSPGYISSRKRTDCIKPSHSMPFRSSTSAASRSTVHTLHSVAVVARPGIVPHRHTSRPSVAGLGQDDGSVNATRTPSRSSSLLPPS